MRFSFVRRFTQHLGEEFMVRCRLPFAAADAHEPEPDFAVLRGRVEDFSDHPSSALLVIEISFEALPRDRRKAAIDAQAGVQEYWIINLRTREIVQHTVPRPTVDPALEPAPCATMPTLSATETIACPVLPLPPRQVSSLLPPF